MSVAPERLQIEQPLEQMTTEDKMAVEGVTLTFNTLKH
jgi:hypothetical protein